MVLMKAKDRDIDKLFSEIMTGSNKSHSSFLQISLACGEKNLVMWIHIDSVVPAIEKSPSGLEWKDGRTEFNWLSHIRQPWDLKFGALNGIELISDAVRPPGATDWMMVQGRWPKVTSPTTEMRYSRPKELDTERPWTSEEEMTLVKLRSKKKSFAEIARKLGRKELQVACKYFETVPFPTSGSVRKTASAPQTQSASINLRGISLYILWLGYDLPQTNGTQGGWRIYGYCEIHCDSVSI